MKDIKAHLLILLATAIISGSFLAADNLSGVINPVALTLLRLFLAALVLAPVVLYKKKWRKQIFSTLPRAMVISLFYVLFFVAQFESLTLTTTLNTATLYTVVPLITAMLSFLVFGQKIGFKKVLVYSVGAIGTVWVIFDANLDLLMSFALNKGDFIFILGSISLCCYSIAMKYFYKNDDMIVLVFSILLSGSLWLAIILFMMGEPLNWDKIQGEHFFSMAYLSLPATLLTVYLFQKTSIILGPNRIMAYVYLTPALVAFLLFFIEGTTIPLIVLPGIMISILATEKIKKGHNNVYKK